MCEVELVVARGVMCAYAELTSLTIFLPNFTDKIFRPDNKIINRRLG